MVRDARNIISMYVNFKSVTHPTIFLCLPPHFIIKKDGKKMFEKQPKEIQDRVKTLANQSLR